MGSASCFILLGLIQYVPEAEVNSRLDVGRRTTMGVGSYVCVMQVIQGLRAELVRTSQADRAEVTGGLCPPLNVSYKHTEI